jgi:hypothetical protein
MDKVPDYYKGAKGDVIDMLEDYEKPGFFRGNILKYAKRAGKKGDIINDLNKIIQYVERWKELVEKHAN